MRLPILSLLPFFLVVSISAQTPSATPTIGDELRLLKNLEHSAGAVPTAYIPAAKDRALAYQLSLESGLPWFEHQLGLHVPMTFYVLDQTVYGSVKDGPFWPVPYSDQASAPDVIVFPTRIEEIAGNQPQETLAGEYILFHEAGHNYASALHIGSGNAWVNELIANLFMAEYINARRPDLKWTLDGPAAHHVKEQPHYTSLRDLDYVYYAGVGPQNYAWYQYEIEQLSGYLVAGQSLPNLVKTLQKEFPLASARQESLEQIIVHLDRIRAGSENFLTPLYSPSILTRILPSACPVEPAKPTDQVSVIGVRNDLAKSLSIVTPDGKAETLAPSTWDTFMIKRGEVLKVGNDRCLIGVPDSSLAIISN